MKNLIINTITAILGLIALSVGLSLAPGGWGLLLLRALLVTVMVIGLWFEWQDPGMGFPSVAAFLAAVLYFVPLYLEGGAPWWGVVVFVLGTVVLFLDIIVTPGVGVLGAAGMAISLVGLTATLAGTFLSGGQASDAFGAALLTVVGGILLGLASCRGLTASIGRGKSSYWKNSAKKCLPEATDGLPAALAGCRGTAETLLKPAGKVSIDGQSYDAIALNGYIEAGAAVGVVKAEAGHLFVTAE